jgi:hypothetical protein
VTASRRLAAILAADVVGYSRLMGEDEAGTAKAFAGIRRLQRAGRGGSWMRVSLSLAIIFLASPIAAAEPPLSIGGLLSEGWEIAGYASGYDNRTSLILFRHAGTNALVQCGVLFDVTRNPHTIINCYELR